MTDPLRSAKPRTEKLPALPPALARVDARAELERALLQLLPGVRRLLFRMLGPRADLDDAVQDTLIELASALPNFEGRSSADTFARRIAVRVAYRYFHKRAPHEALDSERQPGNAATPDDEFARRRTLLRLHRCLAKLPAKRRAAFVLCAIEGLSAEEAAAALGTSAGAVRSRCLHAREELQRLLAAQRMEDVDV